jgi:hypothetical protein
VGAPSHLIGFALAQFASPALWPIAILGSVALGAGPLKICRFVEAGGAACVGWFHVTTAAGPALGSPAAYVSAFGLP